MQEQLITTLVIAFIVLLVHQALMTGWMTAEFATSVRTASTLMTLVCVIYAARMARPIANKLGFGLK